MVSARANLHDRRSRSIPRRSVERRPRCNVSGLHLVPVYLVRSGSLTSRNIRRRDLLVISFDCSCPAAPRDRLSRLREIPLPNADHSHFVNIKFTEHRVRRYPPVRSISARSSIREPLAGTGIVRALRPRDHACDLADGTVISEVKIVFSPLLSAKSIVELRNSPVLSVYLDSQW